MLLLGHAAGAQLTGTGTGMGSGRNSGSQTTAPSLPPIVPEITSNPQMEEDQAKARNKERQKQLVDDTQKLLALANELKADVDKSNKDTLSIDVIRKADEIEKLAHSVKEKMTGT